jgi:hypothetical protein
MYLDIKQAVCLTLDKRIDQFERIKSEWKSLGVNVTRFLMGDGTLNETYDYIDKKETPPIFNGTTSYPTWVNNSGPFDFWKAQIQVITNFCRIYDSGYLLLLEDDIFIESDFLEIYQSCIDFIQQKDVHMLYFGAYHEPHSWSYTNNKHIIRVNGSGGFHAVALHRRICSEILKFHPLGPLDWMVRELHSKNICYAIYPSICSQIDNNYSYIEQAILKKPKRDKK